MSEVAQTIITIENELGLHTRVATVLVQLAHEFESDFFISNGDREVNGKSIMGVLLLQIHKGQKIKISAQGPDAQDLVDAIVDVAKKKFGE